MPEWLTIDRILTMVSLVIAFVAVCVSLYSVCEARKAVLTGEYFSEMADAYAAFLKCTAEFAFRKGRPELDALASALYRLMLFASDEIGQEAQDLYSFAIEWAQSGQQRGLPLDEKVNHLGDLMRKDLTHFWQKNRH